MRWTPQYFRRRYGDQLVPVHLGLRTELQKLGDFLDRAQSHTFAGTLEAPYIRNVFVAEVFPDIVEDVRLPAYCRPNWLESPVLVGFIPRHWARWLELFVSGPGTRFPRVHVDSCMTHAWVIGIFGRKRFWAWPPMPGQPNYAIHSEAQRNTQSLDCIGKNLDEFFGHAAPLEAEVSPGDFLFIPSGWWHTAETVTTSISLSGNFVNETNWEAFVDGLCAGPKQRAALSSLAKTARWDHIDTTSLQKKRAATRRSIPSLPFTQTTSISAVTKYTLLPGADASKLGGGHYLFDRRAIGANVISVPTQRISKRASKVIVALRQLDLARFPRSREEIQACFDDPRERAFIEKLISFGYLEPADSGAVSGRRHKRGPARGRDEALFEQRVLEHFFKKATFFNLPEGADDADVDVGLVGVPFSSTPVTTGSICAPAFLRWETGRRAFWFDICRDGFHSDVGCNGALSEPFGRGVVAKDYGDLGAGVRRVGDLFSALHDFVQHVVVQRRIRPIFVGGDHAITFPIVDSLLRSYPHLCLLHLDAHHDLFYTSSVEYDHATPMRRLLLRSGLTELYSFGLRTTFDPRIEPRARITASKALSSRVHLYSLPAFRRLLAAPELLKRELDPISRSRPCYLSIDVDVLSSSALTRMTSTPAGSGLEWPELLEAILSFFDCLNIVACDVVELNPFHGAAATGEEVAHLSALLALLMDRLSKARVPDPREKTSKAATPRAASR